MKGSLLCSDCCKSETFSNLLERISLEIKILIILKPFDVTGKVHKERAFPRGTSLKNNKCILISCTVLRQGVRDWNEKKKGRLASSLFRLTANS